MRISFDLNDLLDAVQEASSEAPGLLEQAAAMGVAVPGSAQKYINIAGIGAQMLRKFSDKMSKGKSGLEFQGMPDTGPLGRGRTVYIRRRASFQDKDVVSALNSVMSLDGIKGIKEIESTLSLTMSVMNPGSEDVKSDSQVRQAVDHILCNEKLDQPIWDKFGDIIFYCLTTIEAKKPEVNK